MNRFVPVLGLVLTLLLPLGAQAADGSGWSLVPERSNVAFFSVKNEAVGERHRFTTLSGHVSPSGEAEVTIELASVETAIQIRNERMREMLFEVSRFPEATITADVDPSVTGEIDFTGELSLHGQTSPISTRVLVTRTEEGDVVVSSLDPIVVSAAEFGLGEGIDRLLEVAGLRAIASAVPVSFVLTFSPRQETAAL